MSDNSQHFFEIIFNEVSAKDISKLDTLDQLRLLKDFKVSEKNLTSSKNTFGKIKKDGKVLYRYRAEDLRIYFELLDHKVVVNRVLNKNTFKDFLFRSNIHMTEDEKLEQSKQFWELIDQGSNLNITKGKK